MLRRRGDGSGDEYHDGRCDDKGGGRGPSLTSFWTTCHRVNTLEGVICPRAWLTGWGLYLTGYRVLSLRGADLSVALVLD